MTIFAEDDHTMVEEERIWQCFSFFLFTILGERSHDPKVLASVAKNAQIKTIYDDKNAEEKTKPGLRKRGDGSRDSK